MLKWLRKLFMDKEKTKKTADTAVSPAVVEDLPTGEIP